MSADAQRIRELEYMCQHMEKALLLQEKRVWSQDMLKKLEQGDFMGSATPEERERTRQLLEGNLRVAKEFLDHMALELGYETPTVFRLLDPEFVYGAPRTEISARLREQLEAVDARERETGTSHMNALFRELKTRHDAFLQEVQRRVHEDVALHSIFAGMTG